MMRTIDHIEEIFRTVQGFSDLDQLYMLHDHIHKVADQEGDILEIGSWCGRSGLVMGLAAKETSTRIFCVDLFPRLEDWFQRRDLSWSFSVSVQGQEFSSYKKEHPIWDQTFHDRFLTAYADGLCPEQRFRESIVKYGLQDVVRLHRGTVHTFLEDASNQSRKFKLAFIDGDHDYEATCKDIEAVLPRLMPDGILCIDDVGGAFTAITKAVEDSIGNDFAGRIQGRKMFVAQAVSLHI